MGGRVDLRSIDLRPHQSPVFSLIKGVTRQAAEVHGGETQRRLLLRWHWSGRTSCRHVELPIACLAENSPTPMRRRALGRVQTSVEDEPVQSDDTDLNYGRGVGGAQPRLPATLE